MEQAHPGEVGGQVGVETSISAAAVRTDDACIRCRPRGKSTRPATAPRSRRTRTAPARRLPSPRAPARTSSSAPPSGHRPGCGATSLNAAHRHAVTRTRSRSVTCSPRGLAGDTPADEDVAARHGEREHVVKRPVEGDRGEERADRPANHRGDHPLGVDVEEAAVVGGQLVLPCRMADGGRDRGCDGRCEFRRRLRHAAPAALAPTRGACGARRSSTSRRARTRNAKSSARTRPARPPPGARRCASRAISRPRQGAL